MSWDNITTVYDADEKVEAPKFQAIPDGTYSCVVSEFCQHETKNEKLPKYKVEMVTIIKDENTGEDKEATIRDYLEPRRYKMNPDGTPETDKNGKKVDMPFFWRTQQFLQALGASGQLVLEADEKGRYNSVIGLSINAEIKTTTKNGYTNTNVRKYTNINDTEEEG